MKEIPLTRGHVALVDDEDYGRASAFRWYALTNSGVVYATRAYRDATKQKRMYLHHFVTGVDAATYIDHKNHNGLDCQKHNLRIATNQQNQDNSRKQVGVSSQYKGVSWNKQKQRWKAAVWTTGKPIFLGWFKNEGDAARAYNEGAKTLFGEYSCANIIPEGVL